MAKWYAVMMDKEDTDWGHGFNTLEEAKEEAVSWRKGNYPEAYIAVIEDGKDPVCVEEIHEFEEE